MLKLLATALSFMLASCVVTGPVTAASQYVIMAHYVASDGEKVARPYAPGGQVVSYANEKSCKVALEGEQVTGAVNTLKIYLLLNEGEESVESLDVVCEVAAGSGP